MVCVDAGLSVVAADQAAIVAGAVQLAGGGEPRHSVVLAVAVALEGVSDALRKSVCDVCGWPSGGGLRRVFTLPRPPSTCLDNPPFIGEVFP